MRDANMNNPYQSGSWKHRVVDSLQALPGARGKLGDIADKLLSRLTPEELQQVQGLDTLPKGMVSCYLQYLKADGTVEHANGDWWLVERASLRDNEEEGSQDVTEASKLPPRLRKVLDALRQIGGSGRIWDIVSSYIAHECSPTEQAELEDDEQAQGRVYDSTATTLTKLRQSEHITNEGGIWRVLLNDPDIDPGVPPPNPSRPQSLPATPEWPKGWRQRRVLEALIGLGSQGTLREIVAAYVANLSDAARGDCELNSVGWDREYDNIANALKNLKRSGWVTNVHGKWSVVSYGTDVQPWPGEVPGRVAKPRTRQPRKDEVDAGKHLENKVRELGIDFARLIAATAFFAPKPETMAAAYTNRRARPGQGERRGMVVREPHPGTGEVVEVRLDDNSYANLATKNAMGQRKNFVGFEACHIWPKSCYDVRYHTLVQNLVLLPRAIASLTDHDEHVKACLKYRAFELFGWYPGRESEDRAKPPANPPPKPDHYPDKWL